MNYEWTFFILLVFSICLSISESSNSIVVKVELTHYYNPSSLLYNGAKCETLHWANDKCDARIDIDVYEKDDLIARYRSETFDNFNYISSIGWFNVNVFNLPITLRLVVNIHDVDPTTDDFIMMNKVVHVSLGDKLQKMVKIANAYTSMTIVFNLPFLPMKLTNIVINTEPSMIANNRSFEPLWSLEAVKDEISFRIISPGVLISILVIGLVLLLVILLVVIITVVIRRNRKQIRHHSTLVQYIRETDNAQIASASPGGSGISFINDTDYENLYNNMTN